MKAYIPIMQCVTPYDDNPTVEDYLSWAKEQKDPFCQFKYE
ncbi:10947_t:CDS:2 [Entrophospora sp. SA101]|nr:10947_t:CDS:2 [Entrophospora sp. SA101]